MAPLYIFDERRLFMAAVSSIQNPNIKPQPVEGSDAKNFRVKIISALIVTIIASLFVFLIPMNSITLMFFAGGAVGVAGYLFPIYKDELSNLMQVLLVNLKI